MKKKLLRPVPKTENQSEKESVADGKYSHRKLSLRKVIIILAAFLIVSVSVVVPVCVVYVDIPVKPRFEPFDQENDYSVTVVWDKVAGAKSYDVEFCCDDPVLITTNITKGTTKNGRYTVQRHKGNLYFRVRAVKSGKIGKFSDWIKCEIQPWVLSAPVVTINPSDLRVSWIPVNYRFYYDHSNTVSAYTYTYAWETEGEEVVWYKDKAISAGVGLASALVSSARYRNYYQGFDDVWPGDTTLHIKVAALNHGLNQLGGFTKEVGGTPEKQALSNIYEEIGEYGEASLVITKEIFDALPN